MYTISAIKDFKILDNGRIGIQYLNTELYRKEENYTNNHNEFELRYCEYNLIAGHEFEEILLKGSKIELSDSLILDFSLGSTSGFNDESCEIAAAKNTISLKMTGCYLQANVFSKFENLKVKKIILDKCIVDIRRIDFISLTTDADSEFEFHKCKFINSEINFYNFIMNNGHFVINDCEFCNTLISIGAKITDSNVFIISNRFFESRFYIHNSYFTNAAIKISADFKYSLNIVLQTVYCNNSYIDFKIHNISMKDENIFEFEEIYFEGGKLNFEYSKLNNTNLIFKECKFNTFVNLSVSECKSVGFYGSTVNNGIIKIDVKNGCEQISLLELINVGVIDVDWDRNNVYEAIINSDRKSYNDLAKQFLTLKDSYNKLGYFDYEDKSYIFYKRYKLKYDYIEGTKNKSICKRIKSAIKYDFCKLAFDISGEFGMNPKRIIISMVCIIGIFSLIYTLIPNVYFSGIDSNRGILSKIGNSIYFSGITFFTIGYGDIHVFNIVKLLTVIEGFLGVLSMSYFVVSFSRKMIR